MKRGPQWSVASIGLAAERGCDSRKPYTLATSRASCDGGARPEGHFHRQRQSLATTKTLALEVGIS